MENFIFSDYPELEQNGGSITTPRFHFKDKQGNFEYPRYFSAFEKCLSSVWSYKEVHMEEDVRNWVSLSDLDKEVIGRILRGFTQIECVIGDYWTDYVSNLFPKPEIVAMCRWFGAFEALHAAAYNHLSSTLGLNEYEAFMGDEHARNKIGYLLSPNCNVVSPLVKLAIFSGAVEGIALFSSFAVLLSYSIDGKFKGVAMIISWSILDEQQHSDLGISLFKDLRKETGLSSTELNQIREGFMLVVANELSFLENVFEHDDVINGIPKEAFIEFVKYKADERYKTLLDTDEDLLQFNGTLANQVSDWFTPLAEGNVSNDFFSTAKEGSQYISKPNFTHKNVDLQNLCLK